MKKTANFDRLMNVLNITIIKKKFIFFTDTYEVTILYTPYKERIYKITTDYKKLPYEIGDDIKDVIKWCKKNNYDCFNLNKNGY